MKFEEEDTVAYALRKGEVGIGIVNDVYSASASESEDEDYDERLKAGQISVEWYPHGKESSVYGDAVKLVDRTLMLGELVKFPRTNLIGFVCDVRVDCDFAILPLNHFVIKNIRESRIEFVDQFGGFNSEAKYLVYDKWVGVVDSFTYLLTLTTFQGYKCRVKVDADKTDVKDVLAKRSERSAFDDRQWYVGQILKFSTKTLSKAEWLSETEGAKRLPDKMLKRFKNSKSKKRPNNIMFMVEKVEFDSVLATWFSSISGGMTPPNKRIDRHSVDRIQLLSYCDHQFVQIGDRIHLALQPDDAIVTEKQWKTEFYKEITSGPVLNSTRTQSVQNYRQLLSVSNSKGSLRPALQNIDNDDDESNWSDCLSGEDDDGQSTSDIRDNVNADINFPCSKVSHTPIPTKKAKISTTECGHTTTTFSQSNVKMAKPVRNRNRFSSCYPNTDYHKNTRKVQKTAALLVRVAPGRSRRVKKQKLPNGKIIYRKNIKLSDKEFCRLQQIMSLLLQKREKLTPTDKMPAEALFVRSFVDVQWQDGTVGTNIPTVNLAYAETDLDEHVFFPGSFVRLQQDKYKLWPAHGYGVVQWVDHQNRIAEVTWYDLLFDEQNRTPMGGSKLSQIKKEQVSVIELIADPDYSTYGSGSLVLRTSFYDDSRFSNPDDVYVGQVLYINTEGKVVVRWLNGRVENVFPFELCRLADDDAGEEEDGLDEIDDSLDGEFVQNDDDQNDENASSNDAWTDVDDDTDKSARDDGDDDDDNQSSATDYSDTVCTTAAGGSDTEDWVICFDDLMKRLNNLTQNFCDKMIEIRRSCCHSLSPRRNIAISALRVYRLLIRLRQYYAEFFESANRKHDLANTDLINCAQVLQEWLKNTANLSPKNTKYLPETILADFFNDKDPKFNCKVKMSNYAEKEMGRLQRVRDSLKDYAAKENLNDENHATIVKSSKHHCSDGGLTEKLQILLKQTSYYVSKLGRFSLFSESETAQMQRLGREIRNNPLLKELCSISLSSFAGDFVHEQQTTSDGSSKSNAGNEEMKTGESKAEFLSSTADESEYFQRLVETVLSSSNCLNFMEFMMTCISTMFEKKNRDLESSQQDVRLAKIDVCIVICLIMFLSIITNVEENRQAWLNRRELDKGEEDDSGSKKEAESNKTSSNELDYQNNISEISVYQDGGDNSNINANLNSPITLEKMPHFEYVDIEPTEHRLFVSLSQNDCSPKFWRAVRQDMKILQTSLTENVYVKVYEKRSDLLSVMIRGAPDTPYFDGLFLFDIRLKPTYPSEPPTVFYRSYASEKLNPNLYQEGTVCVSLLGTWNGKDSEMWNPGSNLLQVIVSIQGLILNSEPYFNEAGYEVRRSNPDYSEKSRCYNEMALVRNLENLCNIIAVRASPFMKEIDEHLLINVPRLIERVKQVISGQFKLNFPVQPVSIGCARSLERQLEKLESLLNERKNISSSN